MYARFKNKAPREYAKTLVKFLGRPTGITAHSLIWEKEALPKPPKGVKKVYTEVRIVDEYIAHDFPTPHRDYVYTYAHIPITSEKACAVMKVSGSISVDLLRNIVFARCAGLGKNDVSLAFVKDVVDGKASATKAEYARRIKGNINTHPKIFYLSSLMG